MNYGDPTIHLPYTEPPGCLDALRGLGARATGCLGVWLVRVLWMVVGGVVGAVIARGCEG